MACSRDCKKLGLAAGAAVALRFGLEFLTHQVLLGPTYRKPAYLTLWNPEAVMQSRFPAMLLAHVLFGIVFALMYTRGYEDGKCGKGQGIRYGLMAGALLGQLSLIQYAIYPISCKLALAWFASELVQCALIGLAVGAIYRPAPEAEGHSH